MTLYPLTIDYFEIIQSSYFNCFKDKNEIPKQFYFDLLQHMFSLLPLSRHLRTFTHQSTAIYEWIYELTFFNTCLPSEFISVQTSVWSKQLPEQHIDHIVLVHFEHQIKLNSWFIFTADATMNQTQNRFRSQFSLEEHHQSYHTSTQEM